MSKTQPPKQPDPEHDHAGKSEQEARSEGEHGWGYGGRPEEEMDESDDELEDAGSRETRQR